MNRQTPLQRLCAVPVQQVEVWIVDVARIPLDLLPVQAFVVLKSCLRWRCQNEHLCVGRVLEDVPLHLAVSSDYRDLLQWCL